MGARPCLPYLRNVDRHHARYDSKSESHNGSAGQHERRGGRQGTERTGKRWRGAEDGPEGGGGEEKVKWRGKREDAVGVGRENSER